MKNLVCRVMMSADLVTKISYLATDCTTQNCVLFKTFVETYKFTSVKLVAIGKKQMDTGCHFKVVDIIAK